MSYYYKDKETGKILSDYNDSYNKIDNFYVYKTLKTPDNTISGKIWPKINCLNLFIKDGSVPVFAPTWGSVGGSGCITDYIVSYPPILEIALSSISGKYNLKQNDDGFYSTYLIDYITTPELYSVDVFKNDNNSAKTIISDVDYSKGGKLTWRISEENLNKFNYREKGPSLR